MCALILFRILRQLALNRSEAAAEQRAKIGERASCINECQKNGLSLELTEVDRLSILIGHRHIGNFFSDHKDVRRAGGAACARRGFPGHDYPLKPKLVSWSNDYVRTYDV
jgi:hypothetical protein